MIPFTGIDREPAELRAEMRLAFEEVVKSGRWILGPAVSTFEEEWAQLCGVRHAVGTANGLDALELALRGLGVGAGDEVITTPMTALATVIAISRAGATPVLADIDAATALMDVASAERCVTSRTRAVVPVHLYGNGSAAPEWAAFAERHGLSLIEDCAQAHLSTVSGRRVGSFGTAGAFSYYPTKNLGAIGDAGALVTDDSELAERVRVLRNYGQRDRYHHEVLGSNSRLDELQAAILSVRVRWLMGQTERRRLVATRYLEGICNPRVMHLSPPVEPAAHVHHLFVVRCEERTALLQHLEGAGIQALIHYPVPAHRQTPFVSVVRDAAGLAHSERHAATCLSLPCHPGLTDVEIEKVIEAVNDFSGR